MTRLGAVAFLRISFVRSAQEGDSLVKLHKSAFQSCICTGIVLLVLALPLMGCSSNPLQSTPPTIPAAQPAVSPPAAQAPAGVVRPLEGHPQAAQYDGQTHKLVVLSPGDDPSAPASLSLFDEGQAAPRVIALPGPASAFVCDGHGAAAVASRGGYFVVDLVSGRVDRVAVADSGQVDFTAITRRADGRLVLGSADGAVYTLGAAESGTAPVTDRNQLFARVDSLVTQGDRVVVLDRGQTSVTALAPDGRAEQALRAGEGATTMAADEQGRVLVADTRGGQLLVYGVDPLILRQAYPVPQAPYGLVGSRNLAWIAQTAANIVIGYDLSTGIPVEKVRYPTVQQPNSLAFDDTSGTLYVVSGSGAGVQVIEHAAGQS